MTTDAVDRVAVEGSLTSDGRDAYVLRRQDDGRFLTPEYLRWSLAVRDAQRCALDEAKAIQGWLAAIGVRVSRLNSE